MHHDHSFNFIDLKSELHELYINMALRTFARSLISIFIPLYLLGLGFDFFIAIGFYGVFAITHAIMGFPAAWLSSKIGLKHLILSSFPFMIIFFLLLYSINSSSTGIGVLLIGIFGGIGSAFFL
jgi:MFS family permease